MSRTCYNGSVDQDSSSQKPEWDREESLPWDQRKRLDRPLTDSEGEYRHRLALEVGRLPTESARRLLQEHSLLLLGWDGVGRLEAEGWLGRFRKMHAY